MNGALLSLLQIGYEIRFLPDPPFGITIVIYPPYQPVLHTHVGFIGCSEKELVNLVNQELLKILYPNG